MKKTVYIHIGTYKTASTYLQCFLQNNIKQFEQAKVFIPTVRYGNGMELCHKNSWKKYLTDFTVDTNKYNTMILSSEVLCTKATNNCLFDKEIVDLLSNFDVKIIVYVRRSVDFLASWWAQWHKHGFYSLKNIKNFKSNEEIAMRLNSLPNVYNQQKKVDLKLYKCIMKSLDCFIKHYNYNLIFEHINHAGDIFGEENNIIVRPFEKKQLVNMNILDDFLSAINMQGVIKTNNKSLSIVNKGLTVEEIKQLEFLRGLKIIIHHNNPRVLKLFAKNKTKTQPLQILSDNTIRKTVDKNTINKNVN